MPAGGRYVYGPVPSRRLGRSLGVDLVPFKTCSYNCTYCQLGRTTHKTIDRREYVPIASVLSELEQLLAEGVRPDFISLAGSGEPTLNSGLDQLISRTKALTDVPVAVITNGSLLWMSGVGDELGAVDLVLPSLDAGDSSTFQQVNRPEPTIEFDRMVEGLIDFTRQFRGDVWLEVMLFAGVTDTDDQVHKIADLVRQIAPARTQLNTATRPSAAGLAQAIPEARMQSLAPSFPGVVDVICEAGAPATGSPAPDVDSDDILALLDRRPCTAEDVAAGLGLHTLTVLKRLDILVAERAVVTTTVEGKTFYRTAALGNGRSLDSGSKW